MVLITCGKCHNKHSSVEEVRHCHLDVPAPVAYMTTGYATKKQIKYVSDLDGDVKWTTTLTTKEASNYIKRLIARGKTVTTNPIKAAPNRQTTIVPLEMLLSVPEGRYAVRPDSNSKHTFFRVSRPKTGNLKGSFKLQTQHGEDYKLCLVVYPSGSLNWYDMSVEDDMALMVVNTSGAAIEYGQVIGRCCRCGKELTDERSRYFGIGPECEKAWPHIIDIVTDTRGAYVLHH